MKNNLRVLMAKERITITELSVKTGVARSTISRLYHEKSKRIDLDTIATLCSFFNCSVDELILIEPQAKARI